MKRSLTLLAILGALLQTGCGDSTGASATTITFQTDAFSCGTEADIEITIDGDRQGTFRFPPGSQWSFPVPAGTHLVKAQGQALQGGFIDAEREVTVAEGEDFTVLLTCS